MRGRLVYPVCLLLIGGHAAACADTFQTPKVSVARPDWDAARAALARVQAVERLTQGGDALTRLNAATAGDFSNIAASPVPVLLPFDLDAYLRRAAGESVAYLRGFQPPRFFLSGPAGYHAVFVVPREDAKRDAEIHVSGFALTYEMDERVGGEEKPPIGLAGDFPGIRRFFFEHHVRYLFERYGVLYNVSMECSDGTPRTRRLHCNDAHVIVSRFLKSLAIAGGTPQPVETAAALPPRPAHRSAAFSYYPPGQLISGTSARKKGGDVDRTVYAAIRFPLADAPAQTYSQMYINVGDCTAAAGDSRTMRRVGKPFRCIPSQQATATQMPTGGQNLYPWRDSFCEARAYNVGQCPSGAGHQGQDIVPVGCAASSRDSDACDRSHHRIVAVHDGMVLRTARQEGLTVFVNQPGLHARFRYLHMNPKLIDEAGIVMGRTVRAGEIVGKVGNFNGREGGTSYHLHFDMQVPTRDGWVWVNPYMTLISSYERLLGARGSEIAEEGVSAANADIAPVNVPAEYKPLQASTPKNAKKKRYADDARRRK